MTLPWNHASKHVGITAQEHEVDVDLLSFCAPPVSGSLYFTREELAVSIARNLALEAASPPLLEALGRSAGQLLAHLVDDRSGHPFRIEAEAACLGDAALNHLAHDIAAGIAGLMMESMDYIWRANGKELLEGKGRKPDYLWSRGTRELVLSEVKGSVAPKVRFNNLDKRALEGFDEQVCPWIGTSLSGYRIAWGYGIGVHAPAGGAARCIVHQPEVTSTTGVGSSMIVPAPIARANYAAAFRLMGYFEIANYLAGREDPNTFLEPVRLRVVEEEGDLFLVPPDDRRAAVSRWFVPQPGWRFGLRLEAAEDVLSIRHGAEVDGETIIVRGTPERVGERRGTMIVAPDGLALLRSRKRPVGIRTWTAEQGLQPERSND